MYKDITKAHFRNVHGFALHGYFIRLVGCPLTDNEWVKEILHQYNDNMPLWGRFFLCQGNAYNWI